MHFAMFLIAFLANLAGGKFGGDHLAACKVLVYYFQ